MVEKNSDDSVQEEPVIVAAANTSTFGEGIGAAIEIMETRLAKSGVALQCQTPKVSHGRQIADKLRVLPVLIELGISASINSGVGTKESIGKPASKDALVPGNIVALHHSYGGDIGFLRICNKDANVRYGQRSINSLPLEWGWERFLVVGAGNGHIALFSPSHRRFLGCEGNFFDASGYPIVDLDEKPRAHESFLIEDLGNNRIGLICDIDYGVAGKGNLIGYYVVQIHGFR